MSQTWHGNGEKALASVGREVTADSSGNKGLPNSRNSSNNDPPRKNAAPHQRSSPTAGRPSSSASTLSVGSFTVATAASGSVAPIHGSAGKQHAMQMIPDQQHMHAPAQFAAPMRSHQAPPVAYHQETHPRHAEMMTPGSGRGGNSAKLHHPVPYRHHPRPYDVHGFQSSYHFQHQIPMHQDHYGYPYQDHGHYQPDHHRTLPFSGMAPPQINPHYSMPGQTHHHFHPMEAGVAGYGQFQRPMYEETIENIMEQSSLDRSPSPPPPPPTVPRSNSTKRPYQEASTKGSTPGSLPVSTLKQSAGLEGADSTRPESSASNDTVGGPLEQKRSIDDDTASILLQLSAAPSQSSDKDDGEDEQPQMEGRPLSTINTHSNAVIPPASAANLLKPIQASSSMDEDTTMATTESPELTSEPSNDSNEARAKQASLPWPVPAEYPRRLALEHDEQKLNSLHCFIREELLEIFVVEKSASKSRSHAPGSSVGRVGLRCFHCALTRQRTKENRDEAPMAVFYPKSINEIYRLVTSWQRCHLRKCRNLPPAVRAKWERLRENEKSRGKTQHWVSSAQEIGLVNCPSRGGGVRFGPNFKMTKKEGAIDKHGPSNTLASVKKATDAASSSKEQAHEQPVTN